MSSVAVSTTARRKQLRCLAEIDFMECEVGPHIAARSLYNPNLRSAKSSHSGLSAANDQPWQRVALMGSEKAAELNRMRSHVQTSAAARLLFLSRGWPERVTVRRQRNHGWLFFFPFFLFFFCLFLQSPGVAPRRIRGLVRGGLRLADRFSGAPAKVNTV